MVKTFEGGSGCGVGGGPGGVGSAGLFTVHLNLKQNIFSIEIWLRYAGSIYVGLTRDFFLIS